jgi:hypothetical protein
MRAAATTSAPSTHRCTAAATCDAQMRGEAQTIPLREH